MNIISSNVQNRWRDCFAPAPNVRLTLRTNGEEQPMVVTPNLAMVPAGFVAPTAAATLAAGPGGGSMTAGDFVGYMYVYASSHYPFVDNAVTGGGQLWPRSLPSPASAVFTVTSSGSVTVTVTKTTRSDVDNIWIYRTAQFPTSLQASNALSAGSLFYVGKVGNDGLVGTVTYNDSSATDTSEVMELDNYTAPTAQFCVFDGVQWWMAGNFGFDAQVTLNNSSNVTLSDTLVTSWFSGRDGQPCTFDGITTSGYDNQGTFYFQYTSQTTGYVSSDQAGLSPLVLAATGTTRIHIKGFQDTLWRSKPRNPFSWGQTDVIQGTDSEGNATTTLDPFEWALPVGAGSVVALAVISSDRKLKLDMESPTRVYSFDLEQASGDPDTFGATKRTVDEQYSCGSHFTQFPALSATQGRSVLVGLDSKNYMILEGDGEYQQTISDKVQIYLKSTLRGSNEERFWHGGFDPFMEFNCFWVKRVDLSVQGSVNKCDTLIWSQPSTQTWGTMQDPDVSCSTLIYDPVMNQSSLLIGTESGQIGRAFEPELFSTLVSPLDPTHGSLSGFTPLPLVYPPNAVLLLQFTVFDQLLIQTVSGVTYGVIPVDDGQPQTPPTFFAGQTVCFSTRDGATQNFITTIAFVNSSITAQTLFLVGNSFSENFSNGAVSIVPANAVGRWVYMTDALGNKEVWGKIGSVIVGGFEFSAFFTRGSQVAVAVPPITPVPSWLWYLGMTPCYARRYFDLQNEVELKSARELWATMDNLDPSTDAQYLRFYREYSTVLAAASDSFQLKSITQGNKSPSDNFVTKTLFPSSVVYQFGLEYAEFGFLAWTLLNSTIKVQPLK